MRAGERGDKAIARQSFYFKRQTVRKHGNDESLALTRADFCSQSLRVPGAVQHGSLGAAASAWRRQERGSVSDGEAGARGCRLPRGRGSQRSSACRPQTHGIPVFSPFFPVFPRFSPVFPGSRLRLPLPPRLAPRTRARALPPHLTLCPSLLSSRSRPTSPTAAKVAEFAPTSPTRTSSMAAGSRQARARETGGRRGGSWET